MGTRLFLDVRWLVAGGLFVVVAVNAALLWYAFANPPDVVPSYVLEPR